MNLLFLILIISIFGSKFKEGESQILNGFDLEQRDFNYHVSVIGNGSYKCGGGIVDKSHVITAAHCVQNFEDHQLSILVGVKYLRDPEAVKRLVEKKFIPDEYYFVDGRHNDIAVLRLWTPLALGNNIGVITLPTAPVSADDVTICSFSGPERGSVGPGIHGIKLTWVKLMLVPNNVCECMIESPIPAISLCATVIEENRLTMGDSGGILVCDGVAVGILEGGKNYMYTFTRIYNFEYFIRNHIGSLASVK